MTATKIRHQMMQAYTATMAQVAPLAADGQEFPFVDRLPVHWEPPKADLATMASEVTAGQYLFLFPEGVWMVFGIGLFAGPDDLTPGDQLHFPHPIVVTDRYWRLSNLKYTLT